MKLWKRCYSSWGMPSIGAHLTPGSGRVMPSTFFCVPAGSSTQFL
ncbi:MAG: hypothetical protein SPH33_04380 [Atopobiaceae bacterium]|nr:hypothetical protein [Atopobiaceae bacterium]